MEGRLGLDLRDFFNDLGYLFIFLVGLCWLLLVLVIINFHYYLDCHHDYC